MQFSPLSYCTSVFLSVLVNLLFSAYGLDNALWSPSLLLCSLEALLLFGLSAPTGPSPPLLRFAIGALSFSAKIASTLFSLFYSSLLYVTRLSSDFISVVVLDGLLLPDLLELCSVTLLHDAFIVAPSSIF
ncbi:hypothetical protein GOP47_0028623 [Adiantum capillus-veneris]|nr:hypothetical protein GOP47_0028623 [Adiantum capillus-veneris]